MWPDLFQGQSFPSASHVVVIGGAKEYQLWNLRWEGRNRSRSSRSRRAKSSHESHDDAALRGLLMRALVYLCAVSQQNANGSAGVTEGRKEGKNYSYNSLITRREMEGQSDLQRTLRLPGGWMRLIS